MSTEPEQIGTLIFVPNPDYPYPFPVERAPHFWMTEQTGQLAEVVEAYLDGEKLAPEQFAIIKLYLKQYLERAMLTGDAHRQRLIDQSSKIRTVRELEDFAELIAGYGIEVF